MRSRTAVRRPRTEATAIEGDHRQAFPQVNCGVVGLAGLEPAASSLSEMDGRALCYPAFALVVRHRRWCRDGDALSSLRLALPRSTCIAPRAPYAVPVKDEVQRP